MSKTKTLVLILSGVAVCAAVGWLLVTDKGDKTRKKLLKKERMFSTK